ncbi:MAG: phosphohistidine phosphatase, SixA [Myxococcaceae bacterium]|nr:phosphohistidine phosphatase, SixA [Myxococcaceae bacterium]
MGILLVRHAEAISELRGMDDAARWLSKAGRAQVRDVAESVNDKGLLPIRLLASPRVRAVQTAELFAQVLGFRGMVECLPSLSYTVPAEQAARELSQFGEDVAAFGHMPTIAEIAARLTGQAHTAGFGLCEALWIEDGRVVWSVKPR